MLVRLLVPLCLVVCCCGESSPGSGKEGGAPSASKGLPESFALASEPAGARPVQEVVAAAKTGDEVVAVGRVGEEGSDRAYFTLADASVKSCTESGDECPKPWDFCCTPADEKTKVLATVELRDASGALVPGSVLGFRGLDHLKTVVVKGKAEKDAAGNLTIVASGIFVRS